MNELDPVLQKLVREKLALAEADPWNDRHHGILGLVYSANDMFAEALGSLEVACRLEPETPDWSLHAATAESKLGQLDRAIDRLSATLGKHPDFAPGYDSLGHLLLQSGQPALAGEKYERLVSLAPDRVYGYVGLADARNRQGRYAEAADLAREALSLDPDYKTAHHLLGLAYRGLGKREEARSELARGIGAKKRFMPDDSARLLAGFSSGIMAQISQAEFLFDSGKHGMAISILAKALKSRPNDTTVLNNLAAGYLKTDQPERALELLVRAAGIDPNQFATYLNMTEAEMQIGNISEAIQQAERALELAPNLGHAHESYGMALVAADRFEEARVQLTDALRLDSTKPAVHIALGEVCARLDLMEEAKEQFALASRRMPNHLPAHVNLGLLSLNMGDLGQAERALASAERIAMDHPRVRLLRKQFDETGNHQDRIRSDEPR